MNKEKIEALAAAAIAEADALATLYGEVLATRLRAQVEAISTNLVYELASQQARSAIQVKAESLVEEARRTSLEVKPLPIPKIKLGPEKPKLHLAS